MFPIIFKPNLQKSNSRIFFISLKSYSPNDPITESKEEPDNNFTNEESKMLYLESVSEITDKVESATKKIGKESKRF